MTQTLVTEDECTEELFVCESSFDKLRLVGHNWPIKNGPTRAVVLVVHGSGEHGQRYTHVARFFNAHHIACVNFDCRGHGQSGGERGFTPCADALHDDLECIIARVETELYPGVPLVIYSHGTGSVICLTHIVRRPVQARRYHAIIISTPSLCLRKRPNALSLFIARAFANLDPHFRLPVEGNYTNEYTNDPKVVEAYRKDPLVHDRWPSMTVSILLELAMLLEKSTVHPPCPLLIQHGGADRTTPIVGIRKWVRKRVQGDVQMKEWLENYHELHNDTNKDEVFTFIVHWLETKLKI